MAAAWPHLGSEDRFLRFAARVALETVSADTWKARALAETRRRDVDDRAARAGARRRAAANEELFTALDKFPLSTLSDRLRIQKLRVIEVAVSRNGKPSDAAIQRVVADVDAVFPGSSFELNTEMSQILAAFNAPAAVEKTMQLDRPDRRSTRSISPIATTCGRSRRAGRPSQRRAYFKWFNEDHTDDQHRYDYREWFNRVNQQPRIAGNAPYLNLVRTAALATLTDAEKADPELAAILAAYQAPAPGRGGRGPAPAEAPAAGRGRGGDRD